MRKLQLFIVSLWLLFPLLAIKEFKLVSMAFDFSWYGVKRFLSFNIIPATALIFLLIGIYFYLRFAFLLRGSTMLPKRIKRIEDQNYEHLAFLTTYIIPFLRVKLEGRDLVITLMILIIIGAIFIRTNLFYKNPTLALLGYKLYKVDTDNDVGLIVISKQRLKSGDKFHYIHLDDNVYFAKL